MRRVVGIGEAAVSADTTDELITFALGSCLGISVFDPVAKVAGLLHVMLPSSAVNPEKAKKRPHMFVDTGVPLFFRQAYQLGATKERMVVKVAGGASVQGVVESFRIGAQNFSLLRKLFWKNQVLIQRQDVGGSLPRTMSVHVASGTVTIQSRGATKTL
ncbi:MAG: chemotaxis protein CheD [Myxococcota bacterium]